MRDAFEQGDSFFFARVDGDAVDLRTVGANVFEGVLAAPRPVWIGQRRCCGEVGPTYLDMNRGHTSDIERGKREVGLITIQVISKGLGTIMSNLLKNL